jgi:hypothetical protein
MINCEFDLQGCDCDINGLNNGCQMIIITPNFTFVNPREGFKNSLKAWALFSLATVYSTLPTM